MTLKVNIITNGPVIEYELFGTKSEVQKGIVDLCNHYPVEQYSTIVGEHFVKSDEEASAFVTRYQGENEIEQPSNATDGIYYGCLFVGGLCIIIIFLVILITRIL